MKGKTNEIRNNIINCFGSVLFNATNSFLFTIFKHARFILFNNDAIWNVYNNYNLLSINNNQQQIGVTNNGPL